jgi:hypothetical protein
MADMMNFPSTFMDFIKEYSFKDKEEIYTNGADLIPVFRVEQAWDHYTNNAANAVDNIRECIRIIDNNLYDIEDAIE